MKFSILLVVAVLAGESSKASDECLKPKALFGKIVATCGRFNLAYTGDEKVFVKKLNLHTTTSRFELNMCNGGGRYPMTIDTNSAGFIFKADSDSCRKDAGMLVRDRAGDNPSVRVVPKVNMMGREMELEILKPDGKTETTPCKPYDDPNPNPDMGMYLKSTPPQGVTAPNTEANGVR